MKLKLATGNVGAASFKHVSPAGAAIARPLSDHFLSSQFLEKDDFEQENDNAFYIEQNTIRRRENGQESQLLMKDDLMTFENAQIRIGFSPDFEINEMALKDEFGGTLSVREAAEMALILRGITASLPFLMVSEE